jgi:hypothetical protein
MPARAVARRGAINTTGAGAARATTTKAIPKLRILANRILGAIQSHNPGGDRGAPLFFVNPRNPAEIRAFSPIYPQPQAARKSATPRKT